MKLKTGYIIDSADAFCKMKDLNGKYYITEDIDMKNGDSSYQFQIGNFTGILDGQGHTISNLGSGGSVFAHALGSNACIKNIIFKDVNISSFVERLGSNNVKFEKFGITGQSIYPTVRDGAGYYPHFEDCYERLSITQGYAWVGNNWNYSLNRCYTTTNCTVKQGDCVDSYYNSSIAPIGPGIGLATAQFAIRSSFASSWDFKENENDTEYTWYIDERTGYPELHF